MDDKRAWWYCPKCTGKVHFVEGKLICDDCHYEHIEKLPTLDIYTSVMEFDAYFDDRGAQCPHCKTNDTKEYNSFTGMSQEGTRFHIFRVCLTCHRTYKLVVRSNLFK